MTPQRKELYISCNKWVPLLNTKLPFGAATKHIEHANALFPPLHCRLLLPLHCLLLLLVVVLLLLLLLLELVLVVVVQRGEDHCEGGILLRQVLESLHLGGTQERGQL